MRDLPDRRAQPRRMDRRRFLLTSLAGAFAPVGAEAQPGGKRPRVGLLFSGSPGPSREIDAFKQGLREFGYIEGQNIAIEYRFARGQIERLPELAAEYEQALGILARDALEALDGVLDGGERERLPGH